MRYKQNTSQSTFVSMFFWVFFSCVGCAQGPITPEVNQVPIPPVESTVCEIGRNDDRTNVVFSKQHDWILTVVNTGAVDCQNRQGIAKVAMAGIHINLTVTTLSEQLSFNEAMAILVEGYVKGISNDVPFDGPLVFVPHRLGEHQREALLSDARFLQRGQYMHLLTSITGVINANNQAVFHVVFWKLPETELKENYHLAQQMLASVSTSWFRLSDVDKNGEIINEW